MRLVFHVDGEAVGEFAAVVGEDGVNRMREVIQEALEETGRGLGIALGMDFQIDVAGGPVDRDESVALAPFQSRQVLEIDMNEADGCLLEDADGALGGPWPLIESMADQASVDSTAGELGIDAAAHHFGDVVERQLQLRPQFADERLLDGREAGGQRFGNMRAIIDAGAVTPTSDRGLADPELGRQFRDRPPAALDMSPGLRRGPGVGVKVQFHDARRSLMNAMPRSTPIPSNQSPGTRHEGGASSRWCG